MEWHLCYVEADTAYFTNNMDKVWGDDWNDAPYEHNAGSPYQRDDVLIRTLHFTAHNMMMPGEYVANSDVSVEEINAGVVPWLESDMYAPMQGLRIWAGVHPHTFIFVIERSGGTIWVPRGQADPTKDWG